MARKELRIALLLAFIHLVIGNILGIIDSDSSIMSILGILFLPYTFIAGMSDYAGWDWLSYVLEIIGFGFMTIVFYPFSLFFLKEKKR